MPSPRARWAALPAAERAVVRDGLGLGAAVGGYGVSFGALAVAAGLTPAQACALSLAAFTGGSQFAYVGVVAAGGALASAVSGAWLLGTRNALYGVRLAPLLGVRGWRRLLTAQVVIDESTAMAVAQPDPRRGRLAFGVTAVAVYVLWNLATLLGALAGDALGDPRRLGLDGAEAAAFLALLWPRLRDRTGRRTALAGALLAVVGLLVLPTGLAVPLAALAVLLP